MKILVTGATGFCGSHTAAALHRAGHQVRLLVRNPQRIDRAIAPLGLQASALEVQVGDVTDAAAVETALSGCEAVIHSAAIFTLDLRREAELEKTNIEGARNVLGAAARLGLDPIVHVSSTSALWPPNSTLLQASDPVQQPRDLYSRTKAEAERIARALQDTGAPVVTLYPGSIWGPDDPTVGDAVATVMRFAQWGVIPETTGGLPVSDVRDLAAMLTAMMKPGLGPRRFMAGGELVPTPALADMLRRLTGRRFWLAPAPAPVLRALGRLGDVFAPLGRQGITYESMCTLTQMVPTEMERVRTELGVVSRSAEETLRDTLRWMHASGLLSTRKAGLLAHPETSA